MQKKNSSGEVPRGIILEAFFLIYPLFLRVKFSSLFYVISLAEKISYYPSANHNLELQCVICTGVILFALHSVTLKLHCMLSANQKRVLFSCILLIIEEKHPNIEQLRTVVCLISFSSSPLFQFYNFAA